VNPLTKDLIHTIVSQVVEKGGYVTKTKLLKLLYLLDLEYYRLHRTTFTGFQWKFFHLGPWAREFDPLIEDMVRNESLVESSSTKQEYETKFFRASEPRDATGLFPAFADEAILRFILNTWSDASTAEFLDYVYFRTEPMEHGVRNESLDFSSVGEDKPEKYTRPKSLVSDTEISKRRREFIKKASQERSQASFEFTKPRYDQEFEKALEKFDKSDF
jgi:hypothetical protein